MAGLARSELEDDDDELDRFLDDWGFSLLSETNKLLENRNIHLNGITKGGRAGQGGDKGEERRGKGKYRQRNLSSPSQQLWSRACRFYLNTIYSNNGNRNRKK